MLRTTWLRLRNPLKREEGQAALEFVLILPMFFLFFVMLIDFGVAMYGYVSVANAAREGARYGAVNCGANVVCDEGIIQAWTVDRSGGFLSAPGDLGEVDVRWPDGGARGNSVVVNVSHVHSLLFFDFDWTIGSCAEMRLEQAEPDVADAGDPC